MPTTVIIIKHIVLIIIFSLKKLQAMSERHKPSTSNCAATARLQRNLFGRYERQRSTDLSSTAFLSIGTL